jgi:DNA-binding PadR family transcriptional regulator
LTTIDVYAYGYFVPRDALDNPLVLPLLGLLIEQPGHPYDLSTRLADRYRHLDVRRSSVTTLAKSLAAAGLVRAHRRRRVGGRPTRTPYELTDTGYDYVRTKVSRDVVSARPGSKTFILAISYIGILPRGAATEALRRRLTALRSELTTVSAAHSLPEYQMLEVSYLRHLLQTEIDWVQRLADRLVAGRIDWPVFPITGGGL